MVARLLGVHSHAARYLDIKAIHPKSLKRHSIAMINSGAFVEPTNESLGYQKRIEMQDEIIAFIRGIFVSSRVQNCYLRKAYFNASAINQRTER